MTNIFYPVALLFAAFLVSSPGVKAQSLTALEIMKKNEENRKLGQIEASATLTTKAGENPEKEKTFTWWKKLKQDQVHYQTLTRFHSPPTVKGEGVLILEGDQNDNEVLIYLPNFKKIRRVENQQQSGSFMGSAFSYSDIANPHVDEYQYKLLKEESCVTPQTQQKKDCYVIEAVPVEKVKQRIQCSKTVNWILKDNFMVARIDYYGLDGTFFKRLDADQVQLVDPAQKKWMAHWLKMDNSKVKKVTTLELKRVKVNQDIPDAIFTQQNLSRFP